MTNTAHLQANRLRQDLARAVRLIRRGQVDDRVVFRDAQGGLFIRLAGLVAEAREQVDPKNTNVP
jgi:hypothetical protein